MTNESEYSKVQAEPAQGRRPRFWVGPLLVGSCFSLGYGITHRVVTLQANPEPPSQSEPFVRQEFPGQSLASLRRSTGGTGSLLVDVAAIEAKAEAERQAKAKAEEQARRQAELASKEGLALQAPLPAPSWTAPESTEPDQLFLEESQSVHAASIDPLVDPSVDPFNPIDPLLEVSTPEVTLDQNDFFVPVEPIPAPAQ
jgi:hypothetical protein